MKHRLLFTFAVGLLVHFSSAAQYSLAYLSSTTFNLPNADVYATDVIGSPNGGYFLSGWKEAVGSLDPPRVPYMASVDSTGNLLTVNVNVPPADGQLLKTSDSKYMSFSHDASLSQPYSELDLRLTKFTDSLQAEWSSVFDLGHCHQIPQGIIESLDGGFAMCGNYSYEIGCSYPIFESFLIKFNLNGVEQWRKSYNHNNGNTYIRSVEAMSDGGYSLFGWSGEGLNPLGNRTPTNYQLIRTDDMGDTLWTREYNLDSSNYGFNHIVTSEGNMLLAGVSGRKRTGNAFLLMVDSLGDTLWTKKCFRAGVSSNNYELKELPNGNLALFGFKADGANPYDDVNTIAYLLILSPEGDSIWSDGQDFIPRNFTVLSDGDIVTTGFMRDFEGSTLAVHARYDYEDESLGLDAISSEVQWSLYPNPARDILHIRAASIIDRCVMIDLQGREVSNMQASAQNLELPTAHLSSGLYYVVLNFRNGTQDNRKVVVE